MLKQHEGNIHLNTISPRAFEAICLGTALVLFPGHYSGILQPWRHYIPLAKDFSNIEEVVDCLTDLPFLERLTQTAYDEIVNPGTYSYSAFTKKVDDALVEFSLNHRGRAARNHRLEVWMPMPGAEALDRSRWLGAAGMPASAAGGGSGS